jgi:transposase-like protein
MGESREMKKNYFTNEQQEQLRANPYIEKVSDTTITYTKEFRETFMAEYQTGKLPSQILREMDIDPRLLGKRRIDSIVHRSKQYELRPEGCEDTRCSNSGRPAIKDLSDPEKIKRLEQKIAYLKQENEFLKKNIQMDRLARLENKHHHPANID